MTHRARVLVMAGLLLLLGLGATPTKLSTLDQAWDLPPDGLAWLRTAAPVRLRAPAGRASQLLAWRFTATALPAELDREEFVKAGVDLLEAVVREDEA